MTRAFTAIASLKAAMYSAAQTAFAAELSAPEPTLGVLYGLPSSENGPSDVVGIVAVRTTQEPATFGTNRSREEELEVDVYVGVYRGGRGSELEQAAQERAVDLLGVLEQYIRKDAPTLGGVVRECFLTKVELDGRTPAEVEYLGVLAELEATFTAKVRITT